MNRPKHPRRALLAVPFLLGLAACGGDNAEAINVCHPVHIAIDDKGNATVGEWTPDEHEAMVAACDAGKELQKEDMQPLIDAIGNDFVFEDYDEAVCPAMDAAAAAIDRMGFLATNANNTVTYIVGEAVRWDQVDAVKVACADEISAYRRAAAKHD